MGDVGWAALRAVLVENYDDLARRLTRRLRSPDLAQDALQKTYLRIERGGKIGPVDYPLHYILRIATNIARDGQRSDRIAANMDDIAAALNVADDRPDPARVVEAKQELAVVEQALAKMTVRRRAIFLASWKEHLSSKEIAKRYDLSVRQIDVELKKAKEQCALALRKIAEK